MQRDALGTLKRFAGVAAIAVAAALALPAAASAGSVSTTSNTITFNALAGEANGITVANPTGTEITISDTVLVQITEDSADCIVTGLISVSCDLGALPTVIFLNLGDQGDSANSSTVAVTAVVDGGGGADTVTTGDGNDSLLGGAGADVDTLTAGVGSDYLDGEFGPDVLSGGGGIGSDTVNYENRTAGVEVDLGDTANANDGNSDDGAENARDSLSGIEDVIGTPQADTIVGDGSENRIDGRFGSDSLDGAGGIDTVTYESRATAVTADLVGTSADNGNADDGAGDTLEDFENAVGGEASAGDTLTGNAAQNLIQGGGGNDTIDGGDEDDLLDGGEGDDAINGQGGNDGGLYGFGGDDSISGGTGDDSIFSGDDDDSASGGIGSDTIEGGNGNDTGLIGAFTGLDGGAGNDTVKGGAGDDQLIGGDDTDLVSFEDSVAGVVAGLTANTATGEGSDTLSGFENLTGSNLDDDLIGDAGANAIDGLDGVNQMQGLGGNDTFTGGIGVGADTVSYENEAATVADVASTATNSGGTDTFTGGIDNLTGSTGSDSLSGDASQNALTGGGGSDTLIGLGDDDDLSGDAGDDTLRPGAGSDDADGGADDDTVVYSDSTTRVVVNLVSDTVNEVDSSSFDDVPLIENVIGSEINSTDHITGDTGPNRIEALAGPDTVIAGDGADVIEGGADGDLINAGSGNDTLAGNGGADSLNGQADTDTITYVDAAGAVGVNLSLDGVSDDGDGNIDFLDNDDVENVIGSPQGDTLIGRDAQANVIDGGGGDDTIMGNGGNDVLDGEAGTDTATYQFAPAAVTVSLATETSSGGDDADVLDDFENLFGSNIHGDTLIGDGGPNVLQGFTGDDSLTPGAGADTVLASFGADQLFLRDDLGDTADCGSDADVDTVEADGPAGTETLTNCNLAGDVVSLDVPPTTDPGTVTPPTPAPKKCKKGQKLKKGKCVKKKKKKKK